MNDGGTISITADDDANGTGTSLREAILFSNSNPGTDSISFNILGAGPRTITVEASDGTNIATASAALTINNVAPSFDAGTSEMISALAAGSFNRSGIPFTDPGTLDVHTVTVDYDGDSVIDQTINVPLGGRTFDLSHTYAISGTYTVSVTVNDGDTGSLADTVTGSHAFGDGGICTITVTVSDSTDSDSERTTAFIVGVRLTDDGVLQIVGTNRKDIIHVHQHPRRDKLTVHARLGIPGGVRIRQMLAASEVDQVLVYGCDGDDHIHVGGGSDGGHDHHKHKNKDKGKSNGHGWSDGGSNGGADVSIPARIFGGGGRDHIWSGQADDFIDGGEGDDFIHSRKGDDTIVDLRQSASSGRSVFPVRPSERTTTVRR